MSWEMPGLLGRPYTVDSHAHLNPPRWATLDPWIRPPDLDTLFAQQDAAGVDLTVFGQTWFYVPTDRPLLDLVREVNDFSVELTARHPQRLLGLAATNPFGYDALAANWRQSSRCRGRAAASAACMRSNSVRNPSAYLRASAGMASKSAFSSLLMCLPFKSTL